MKAYPYSKEWDDLETDVLLPTEFYHIRHEITPKGPKHYMRVAALIIYAIVGFIFITLLVTESSKTFTESEVMDYDASDSDWQCSMITKVTQQQGLVNSDTSEIVGFLNLMEMKSDCSAALTTLDPCTNGLIADEMSSSTAYQSDAAAKDETTQADDDGKLSMAWGLNDVFFLKVNDTTKGTFDLQSFTPSSTTSNVEMMVVAEYGSDHFALDNNDNRYSRRCGENLCNIVKSDAVTSQETSLLNDDTYARISGMTFKPGTTDVMYVIDKHFNTLTTLTTGKTAVTLVSAGTVVEPRSVTVDPSDSSVYIVDSVGLWEYSTSIESISQLDARSDLQSVAELNGKIYYSSLSGGNCSVFEYFYDTRHQIQQVFQNLSATSCALASDTGENKLYIATGTMLYVYHPSDSRAEKLLDDPYSLYTDYMLEVGDDHNVYMYYASDTTVAVDRYSPDNGTSTQIYLEGKYNEVHSHTASAILGNSLYVAYDVTIVKDLLSSTMDMFYSGNFDRDAEVGASERFLSSQMMAVKSIMPD
jgi:hypothetical protein